MHLDHRACGQLGPVRIGTFRGGQGETALEDALQPLARQPGQGTHGHQGADQDVSHVGLAAGDTIGVLAQRLDVLDGLPRQPPDRLALGDAVAHLRFRWGDLRGSAGAGGHHERGRGGQEPMNADHEGTS